MIRLSKYQSSFFLAPFPPPSFHCLSRIIVFVEFWPNLFVRDMEWPLKPAVSDICIQVQCTLGTEKVEIYIHSSFYLLLSKDPLLVNWHVKVESDIYRLNRWIQDSLSFLPLSSPHRCVLRAYIPWNYN